MIDRFEKEYEFLSNFYPVEVVLDGVTYPTVEHAYQAAKFTTCTRIRIRECPSPGAAKRAAAAIGYDKAAWSKVKLDVMRRLLEQKFAKPELRALLEATGSQELVEGNYWGDVFWGVYNGKGKNHLGKQLMSIRNGIAMGLN